MAVLVLVVTEDCLVDIVVGDISSSEGASSVNLQPEEIIAQELVSFTISGERQPPCRQACKGKNLAYLDLWGQEVAVLALVEAKDCLVHIVVCHVTGSQGASSVRLISQKACIVTGLPTSRSVMEDFYTGFLTSSRVHENC